ncbi:MAG: hypothetical protein A3G49_01175 [Candidatus Sungbacteria bacterium RIFCSPLOWO2_12_FULL_41_11]|uniref:Uncharacterized protein n=1 Tax=Candidatus Sungbacteria bacterium RIFCSPLOWO2_12_FULL_41_11 TaxID=1802286 RepID=A0A1G2LM93_9BACT|nr:MAG: hypothetical protein UV01_C0007G0044 [Parcubacteria group bacterium GW2011_GWA2_42_14]OGZ98691.1 MAG: hypothetical protein A3D41_02955 [Candidatus Sungbacteria bacterium RIFCSPHIGHO2_02_FULL_41_12b]OHA12736.1 MAG: hypothetical protein A3G49_01175 [Candidatus Sungbacteria bacterium RIFCSPLOWO2_12_FULL_41_11]
MALGEAPIKKAVKWIDEQFRENPKASRFDLIERASFKFNLSPLDGDFLYRHFSKSSQQEQGK